MVDGFLCYIQPDLSEVRLAEVKKKQKKKTKEKKTHETHSSFDKSCLSNDRQKGDNTS